MLRILYITDSLMAGGIESQLVELVTRLDRARFEPIVLSLYGPTARDLHFAPQLQAAHVPLVLPDLGWSAGDKARGMVAIIRAARMFRPHLIQAEGYHANLLVRLAWPLLPRTSRLIGTVRGKNSPKQMRYERLSWWMCRKIVTNAAHLKTDLHHRGHVPLDHILCVPNGIDTNLWRQPGDIGVRERIAPDARFVLLSLTRISFEKNVHWIAQALGLLKKAGRLPQDMKFIIAGPIQDIQAQRALDREIETHELANDVVQLPATRDPEAYYFACDTSVLFSPDEGLPNVALESLASGRPVVISAAANTEGMITDGKTGWIVPTGDVARLAETLERVLALSHAELAGMRQACLDRAAEYSVDALVRRYTRLYESWVTPSSAARSLQAASVRESPSRGVTRGS
ncbi:MAG TPA: glycosyltransferase family 4 protein [Ktedonobacterales bacterium]|nr:glycosyltransferase family 4 protein [Ktedonobacterales bacterium]